MNTDYAQPDDLVNRPLPFSYITLSATSDDGNTHDIQVYLV
jgi:hypothetical protein